MTFMVNSAECLEIAGVPTERKGEKHSYLRLTDSLFHHLQTFLGVFGYWNFKKKKNQTNTS